MKAAVIREFGDFPVLQFEDVETPTPGPGNVLLKIRAAGVNRFDHYIREGSVVPELPFPHILGADAAGEIAAVGDGVPSYGRNAIGRGDVDGGQCGVERAGDDQQVSVARYDPGAGVTSITIQRAVDDSSDAPRADECDRARRQRRNGEAVDGDVGSSGDGDRVGRSGPLHSCG